MVAEHNMEIPGGLALSCRACEGESRARNKERREQFEDHFGAKAPAEEVSAVDDPEVLVLPRSPTAADEEGSSSSASGGLRPHLPGGRH
jgi:hypothetical protein